MCIFYTHLTAKLYNNSSMQLIVRVRFDYNLQLSIPLMSPFVSRHLIATLFIFSSYAAAAASSRQGSSVIKTKIVRNKQSKKPVYRKE